MGPRTLLTMLFAALLGTGAAQELYWTGMVVDSADGRPIAQVNISAVSGSWGTSTDSAGVFEVPSRVGVVTVRLSHIGYATRTIEVGGKASKEPVHILLIRAAVDLAAFDVTRRVPEVVFQRDDLHVADFKVDRNGIWVLAYEHRRVVMSEQDAGRKILRGVRLFLLDTAFSTLTSATIPGEVIGLHRAHDGRILVETYSDAFVLHGSVGAIELEQVGLKVLYNAILPWTDALPGKLLGSDQDPGFPAFDHFAYAPRDSSVEVYCSVIDAPLMELFRSQYKYMSGRDKVVAMDLAREKGVDKQIIAGYMTGFQFDPYFRALYAPMFRTGDTLCVFDHYKACIRRFDAQLTLRNEVPIGYHERRDWEGELLQDPIDEHVYASFKRRGVLGLCQVETTSGELGRPHHMQDRYPEQVQIHGGYVYYVYRPKESLEHRTLYREALY